jgi:hypothetical protein
MPSPFVSIPQPLPCVSATTPSTLAREVTGNPARDRRRAIHRRQDSDVVARRDPAVRPDNAHERRGLRDELRRLRVGAERIVALEAAHREVVQMHVLAGGDVAAREADDLVVALDRGARAYRMRRDLVPDGDEAADREILFADPRAADQLRAGDDDVVVGMKSNGERSAGEHGNPFRGAVQSATT